MADYNFTVKNHYQPFSMQEMLTPFLMYNDAYEKVDEAYTELQRKADVFSNLAKSLPGQSKASEIYNGYANDLRAQAEDLAKNGLSMNNRRALSSLKRRYEGEIGRLDRANTTFQEVLKARRAAQEQGLPMLYATNNLTIDSFLDNETPNMFGINSNELYTRGANIGKNLSSRNFSTREESILGGYYYDFINSAGVKDAAGFVKSDVVQQYIDRVLQERGVAGNLSGEDYMRARQSLENGIYEGIVYTESHTPQRNLDKMTPDQIDTMKRGWASLDLQRQQMALSERDKYNERIADGYILDKNGFIVDWDPSRSLSVKRAAAIKAASSGKGGSSGESGGSGGTMHEPQLKKAIRLSWKGNNPKDTNGEADDDMNPPQVLPDDIEEYAGEGTPYEKLPTYVRKKVDNIIGRGDPSIYTFYYKPFKKGFINDDETVVDIVPTHLVVDDADADIFSVINQNALPNGTK